MYTITEATTFIEEKTSDGETHKFYLLSIYDRSEIAAEVKRIRKKALADSLALAELDKEQRYAELEAFEDDWTALPSPENGKRDTTEQVEYIKYINSPAGFMAIAERALRGENDKAREIVAKLKLPKDRMLPFVAALTGLDIITTKTDDNETEQGENAANPPKSPATTYGS